MNPLAFWLVMQSVMNVAMIVYMWSMLRRVRRLEGKTMTPAPWALVGGFHEQRIAELGRIVSALQASSPSPE